MPNFHDNLSDDHAASSTASTAPAAPSKKRRSGSSTVAQVRHGFYSHERALIHGWCVYLTPDGEEVTVTGVYDSKEACNAKWDDIQYVGPVTDYVKGEHYDPCRFLPPDLDDESKKALAWATEEWIKEYKILADGMKLTVKSMYWEVRLGFLPRSSEYKDGFGRDQAKDIVGRVCFAHQLGCGFPSIVPLLNGEEESKTDKITRLLARMF
jgi:hypothetical protein